MRLKWVALGALLSLVLIVGGVGLWLRSQQRHYVLNRQLISALEQGDNNRALALVNEGADPNTRSKPTPTPSLFDLCKQLLHRSPPPSNDSPTALSISCGAFWDHEPATMQKQRQAPEATQLVQAMLLHGGNANLPDRDRVTPLFWAVFLHRHNTVGVLLDHGAKVDAKSATATTALMFAVRFHNDPEIVRSLLAHNADVNAQDQESWTPLYYFVRFIPINSQSGLNSTEQNILAQLLTHGANPNLPNKKGDTPFKYVQRANRVDLMTLFKQAGARK
jgi:hypothetical protein